MPATPVTMLEAKRRLRLFNKKTQTLLRGRFKEMVFIKDHGFTVDWTPGSGTIERRGADEDATFALVSTIRFFVQPKDGVSFSQMGELYESLPVSEEDRRSVKDVVAKIEAFWNAPISFATVIDDEHVTNWKLFEIFMYGSLAHENPDKAAYFEKWIGTSPLRLMMETAFEEIVIELIRAAYWFQDVNERTLKQLESD